MDYDVCLKDAQGRCSVDGRTAGDACTVHRKLPLQVDACEMSTEERCVQLAMQSKARLLDGMARRYRHAVRSKFKPRKRQSDVLQPTLPRLHTDAARDSASACVHPKRPRLVWHDSELQLMLAAVKRVGVSAWHDVARMLPGRSAVEARDMHTAVRRGLYHHSRAGLTSASRSSFVPGASRETVPRGVSERTASVVAAAGLCEAGKRGGGPHTVDHDESPMRDRVACTNSVPSAHAPLSPQSASGNGSLGGCKIGCSTMAIVDVARCSSRTAPADTGTVAGRAPLQQRQVRCTVGASSGETSKALPRARGGVWTYVTCSMPAMRA